MQQHQQCCKSTLNKIGIGNGIDVIFIICIINICILILFFKFVTLSLFTISLVVSKIRGYKILRFYKHYLNVGKFLQLEIIHVLYYDGKTNYIDTVNDAITVYGSDNSRPNLLAIILDRDPTLKTSDNPCATNNLKNAFNDGAVAIIVVGEGVNLDNKDKQLIYEQDATSIQMCDFGSPNGGTRDFNQHTGC